MIALGRSVIHCFSTLSHFAVATANVLLESYFSFIHIKCILIVLICLSSSNNFLFRTERTNLCFIRVSYVHLCFKKLFYLKKFITAITARIVDLRGAGQIKLLAIETRTFP